MWKQVVAPVLLVTVFWGLATGASMIFLGRMDDVQDRMLSENVSSIRAARRMQNALWRMHIEALADDCPRDTAQFQRLKALEQDFADVLARAERTANEPDESAAIAEIRTRFQKYAHDWRAATELCSAARDRNVARNLRALADQVVEPTETLLLINDRGIAKRQLQSQSLARSWLVARIVLFVVGPGVGLFVGLRLARGMYQSMARISIRLKDVAGDLEREVGCVDIAPQVDLPAIQEQVEQVAARIQQIVSELEKTRLESVRKEQLAAVGELAAGIAHELRNPLTSVKLLIQTALHRDEHSLSGKPLEIVQAEVARMESTIQELLEFARPPRLQRQRHNLLATLQSALNLTGGRAAQQSVVIEQIFDEHELWVAGDSQQLQQVFVNLVLNAIESMPEGGRLRISAGRQDEIALITVADSGHGIPDEIFSRLFQPFVSSKERGTGLGLAISRRIVQDHGGQLDAANRPEGGAVFSVTLPLAENLNELPAVELAGAAAQ